MTTACLWHHSHARTVYYERWWSREGIEVRLRGLRAIERLLTRSPIVTCWDDCRGHGVWYCCRPGREARALRSAIEQAIQAHGRAESCWHLWCDERPVLPAWCPRRPLRLCPHGYWTEGWWYD